MSEPRIDFYILGEAGPDAREDLACRLIEKAYGAGLPAFVLTGGEEQTARLDERLWTFRQGSFLPHARAETRDIEPVGLGTDPAGAASGDRVLFNLTERTPPAWDAWHRLVEIIDRREDVIREGRVRFRHYRGHGLTPQTHDLSTQ